jgi:hypothetical protein
MPQRTLHGKRHIRARASVQIGRDRKRLNKMKRIMPFLKKLNRVMIEGFRNIIDFIHKASLPPVEFTEEQKEKIRKLSEDGCPTS